MFLDVKCETTRPGSNNPNIRCLPIVKSQAALLKRLNLEELVDCALDASVGLWVS